MPMAKKSAIDREYGPMVSKQFHPQDKVRVLENLYDPHSSLLSVTAGSLGSIISFDEYCDYIKREFEGKDTPAERAKHFSMVSGDIQEDRAFIVKIESFAPSSDTTSPSCLEDVLIIRTQYLEKLG